MDWIADELRALAATHRLRAPTTTRWRDAVHVEIDGRSLRAFCGNDYLGLRFHPDLRAAALAATLEHGTGSGASRMVSGNLSLHESAEDSLASHFGAEAALLCTSGYALNVGVLGALLGPDDVVFSDALNHASLIDGMRLARSRVVVYPHNDLDALRAMVTVPARRRWIVTESLFSMDGDAPDLRALRAIADAAGASLYVDEAHAIGVYGPAGRGLCAAEGITADVRVGTLGKSLGGSGAFVLGSSDLARWLWNRCRAHVFSTGLAPANAAVARAAVGILSQRPELQARLHANTVLLRGALRESGIAVLGRDDSPILPVVIGDDAGALTLALALREEGFFVQAIRPPTVPEGGARLRITVSAAHTPDALRDFARALRAKRPR
jgi:8-amino-7-oxononanoate synthase